MYLLWTVFRIQQVTNLGQLLQNWSTPTFNFYDPHFLSEPKFTFSLFYTKLLANIIVVQDAVVTNLTGHCSIATEIKCQPLVGNKKILA